MLQAQLILAAVNLMHDHLLGETANDSLGSGGRIGNELHFKG